ncbi:MAG: hypothetical protein ABFS56_35655 [Pseudomonadota bacterium]
MVLQEKKIDIIIMKYLILIAYSVVGFSITNSLILNGHYLNAIIIFSGLLFFIFSIINNKRWVYDLTGAIIALINLSAIFYFFPIPGYDDNPPDNPFLKFFIITICTVLFLVWWYKRQRFFND